MRALATFLSRSVLFTLAAVACLLPFVVLAGYSHPVLDDFAIGHYLRGRSMMQYVAEVYGRSSGRYAASLFSVVLKLFGTHPAAYQRLILINLLALVASLYAVAYSLVRGMAHAASLAVALGGLLTVAALVNFPWPAEGIFWLTGSVAYLYPAALTGLLAAVLGHLYAAPARAHRLLWIVAVVTGFLVPGFSEITALLLPLVYAGAWAALRRPGMRSGWWVVGAAIALGSVLTLASPAHWGQWRTLGPAPLAKIALSAAGGTAYLVVNWLGNGLLPLLALLALPLAPRLAGATNERFLLHRLAQRPWLWPVLTVAGVGLACLFCYAATGQGPALRVKNLLYLYFVAGWLLSAYAWASRLDGRAVAGFLARPVQAALAGWALVAGLSDYNTHLTHDNIGRGSNAVVQAYRDWLGGSARRYDQQQRARVAQVRAAGPGTTPLRLDPLRDTPLMLFYYDISANEHLWGNVAYASFYGGPPVYVLPAGAPR